MAAGGDTVQVAAPGLPAPPAPIALTDQASAPAVATADFDLTVTPAGGGPAETVARYLGSETHRQCVLGNAWRVGWSC